MNVEDVYRAPKSLEPGPPDDDGGDFYAFVTGLVLVPASLRMAWDHQSWAIAAVGFCLLVAMLRGLCGLVRKRRRT